MSTDGNSLEGHDRPSDESGQEPNEEQKPETLLEGKESDSPVENDSYEPADDDSNADKSDEERACPECGRSVALKTKSTCAYCGAGLPWATEVKDEEDDNESPDNVDIEQLLSGRKQAFELPGGATYPKACGACGEPLPEEILPQCPHCHTTIRDPFTGRLISGDDATDDRERHKRFKTLLGMLIFGILLLGMLYLINVMVTSVGR